MASVLYEVLHEGMFEYYAVFYKISLIGINSRARCLTLNVALKKETSFQTRSLSGNADVIKMVALDRNFAMALKRFKDIEPRHEKTFVRDFRPGKTQTGLLS